MKYWIYLNNEKSGPYSVEQLIEKTIPPTTLVWCDGMPAWCPAKKGTMRIGEGQTGMGKVSTMKLWYNLFANKSAGE